MRFMMLLKADKDTEAGVPPSQEALQAMATYNEALLDAGALVDGVGLQPSSRGARITFRGGKPRVTDGPFAETKELIAGYWMIEVGSREEALEWAKRVPHEHIPSNPDGDPEIEVRQVFELEDFEEGAALDHHRRIMEELGQESS